MLDGHRLGEVLGRLGCGAAGTLSGELVAAYSGPGRHYHNADHLAGCLTLLDRHRGLARRPDEVELALWFHDAVYDSRRGDNEERSAEWARVALGAVGLPPEAIGRVAAMILATKDHEADDPDAELLLDIDLSILGAPPADFQTYDEAIRCEYAWVPEGDYRAGRARVLRSFLDRAAIYRTAPFRRAYEAQARANLGARLAGLGG